jgi:CheY-like chemotaxis protein
MKAKVLVADDSLTIQKVIGITLASSGYELVECLNQIDLLRLVQTTKFDLVLLDFNLSDNFSGYELAKQVRGFLPEVAIMVMLGTFDTVEDSLLNESGIADKIVKPFESGKFIKKCSELIEQTTNARSEKSSPKIKLEVSEDKITAVESNLDSWVVDAPKIHKDVIAQAPIEEIANVAHDLDPLASELAGWSVDANANLEEKYNKSFPSVVEHKHEVNVLERFQESSVFVAEEATEEVEEVVETTQPTFEIPLDLNQQLITEINDEFSPDSFWAVDDIVSIESEDDKQIKETHLDDVVAHPIHTANFSEDELVFDVHPKVERVVEKLSPISEDEIVEKLKVSLRPIIEELVKEYCRQSAEKVAWEVIPDLAENLIRKELKEISDSV